MSIFLELFQKNSFQVFLTDLWGYFYCLSYILYFSGSTSNMAPSYYRKRLKNSTNSKTKDAITMTEKTTIIIVWLVWRLEQLTDYFLKLIQSQKKNTHQRKDIVHTLQRRRRLTPACKLSIHVAQSSVIYTTCTWSTKKENTRGRFVSND